MISKNIYLLLFSSLLIGSSITSECTAQESTLITFFFNADSAYIVVDYLYDDAVKIGNGDQVPILKGQHVIELSTYYDKAPEKKIFIGGSGLILNYFFRDEEEIKNDYLHKNFAAKQELGVDAIIYTDDISEIYLNDEFLGKERVALKLTQQFNTLRIENPYRGSIDIEITKEPYLQILEPYKKPTKRIAQTVSLVPGFSQGYKRQYLKGAAFLVCNVFAFNLYLNAMDEYSSEKDHFNVLVAQYNATKSEQTARELGNQIEALQGEIKNLDARKNLFLGTTIGLYVLNIFDALRSKPKGGYRTNNFNIEFEVDSDATVRFNF